MLEVAFTRFSWMLAVSRKYGDPREEMEFAVIWFHPEMEIANLKAL